MEPSRCVNVVLDIDEVLSSCKRLLDSTKEFYSKRGLVIEAVKTHYVFPGVIEFLQSLFALEGVRVSFFSSGSPERNLLFVEKLLRKALGDETYRKIQSKVVVLSEGNLVKSVNEDNIYQKKVYGFEIGRWKKDLNKVPESIENTILIDDKHSYALRGQEKNLLWAPQMQRPAYWFSVHEYDAEGYRKIRCRYMVSDDAELHPFDRDQVLLVNQIVVLKVRGNFEIGFLNSRTGEYEQRALTPDQNDRLTRVIDEETSYYLEKPEQEECIHEIVQSYGGMTRAFCLEVNRIYYIAGLFFKALETARKESLPVTEVLFRWQFKKVGSTFEPVFEYLARWDEFYRIGLERLKEVNPSLEFITPSSTKWE